MVKYNLITLIRDIFPTFWQNKPNNELCDLVIEECFANVNEFYGDFEADKIERVGYSIERKSLEDSLNAKYDSVLSRITVQQGIKVNSEFIFNEIETIPTDLDMFIYNEAEAVPVDGVEAYVYNEAENVSGSSTGFIVNVPIEYLSIENNIRQWIEAVQVYGTIYEIIFY